MQYGYFFKSSIQFLNCGNNHQSPESEARLEWDQVREEMCTLLGVPAWALEVQRKPAGQQFKWDGACYTTLPCFVATDLSRLSGVWVTTAVYNCSSLLSVFLFWKTNEQWDEAEHSSLGSWVVGARIQILLWSPGKNLQVHFLDWCWKWTVLLLLTH